MRIRFDPDPTLLDQIGDSPAMRSHLRGASAELRAATAENLPGRRRRTQPFIGKWFSKVEGSGRDVAIAAGTRWRIGHIIEFGSANNPAYSPLRRAARSIGLRFEEGR